jgi:hypothetical protein
VTSIRIANGALILVVATNKCRATAYATLKLQDGAIDPLTDFNHGIGFVHVWRGK